MSLKSSEKVIMINNDGENDTGEHDLQVPPLWSRVDEADAAPAGAMSEL